MSNETDKPSALQLVADAKQTDLQKRLAAMSELTTFDWKQLPPHIMATVLMKKPYRGKANEPDYYLTPEQALVFAMRCFELGLSPLSSEVWFDRDRWSVNVTLEGKIRLARERGITSAPGFRSEERDWRKGSVPLAGYAKEPGITATIKVADGECSYTVWLSEWMVPSSPVWKAKPEHMMRVRAYDKALAFAAGVGVSEMPSEKEIDQTVDLEPTPAPAIKTSRVPFIPQTAQLDDLAPVLEASIDAKQRLKEIKADATDYEKPLK